MHQSGSNNATESNHSPLPPSNKKPPQSNLLPQMPGKKGIMMTMPQFEALRKTLTDGSFDWACDQIEVNKEPEKKAKKQKKEKKAEKKELDEDEE